MNGVYIRELDNDEFTGRVMPFLERDLPQTIQRPLDADYIRTITPLIQERAKTLGEVPQLIDFFFVEELEYDAGLLPGKKLTPAEATHALQVTLSRIEQLAGWDRGLLEEVLRPLAEELNLKTGVFFGLLRVATTGRTVSPPLFETMEVLGKEKCLRYFKTALEKLSHL